jgi:FKBP-type peptidyl-prolyl cis-trans isomerase SlyD
MSESNTPPEVQDQTVVALTWVMKDTLGEELDVLEEPAEFLIGGEDLLAKIEAQLMGKAAGEMLDLHLEQQDAFGDYIDKLVFIAPRDKFPEQLEEGMLFEGLPPGCNPDAPQDVLYHVTDIYPDHVVLDGNHPLAGMAIRLRIKIEGIRAATVDEIGKGSAGVGFFKMAVHDDDRHHGHLH